MNHGLLQRTLANTLYIVTLELCNIKTKLPSESLCSWPPENRSVASKGVRGPRLRNPEAIEAQKQKECHPLNLPA